MITESVRLELDLPDYHVDVYNLTEMVTYWSIFEFFFEALKPKSICEIGSNKAITTEHIYKYATKNGIAFDVVDPCLEERLQEWSDISLFNEPSAAYFKRRRKCDVYIIDGDHNYSTVMIELEAVKDINGVDSIFCLIHDVSWPWARRDLFYNPDYFCDKEGGYDEALQLESDDFVSRGFPNGRSYLMASQYGGEGNGVHTAVENFVARNSGQLTYFRIPTVFGLGIVISKKLLDSSSELQVFLGSLERIKPMLSSLEANRLRLIQGLNEHQDDLLGVSQQLLEKHQEVEVLRGKEDAANLLKDELSAIQKELQVVRSDNTKLKLQCYELESIFKKLESNCLGRIVLKCFAIFP